MEMRRLRGYVVILVLLMLFYIVLNSPLHVQSGVSTQVVCGETVHNALVPSMNRKSRRKATRMCTHEERVKHLQSYCDDKFGYPLSRLVGKETLPEGFSSTKVFVNKEYKYMWCEVSKAGCTTLQQIVRYDYVTKEKRRRKHVDTMYKRYQDYNKFVNVRHPFDRLLSAYYHTIRKNAGEKRGPGTPQLEYLGTMYNTSNHNITLTQFVEFLVSPHNLHPAEIYYDRHWDSFARSCKVCSVDFKYILRTETFIEDSKPFLKLVKYPENYMTEYQPQNQNPHSDELSSSQIEDIPRSYLNSDVNNTFEKHLPQFEQLDKQLIDRLYDKYKHDFEAFGYQFDLNKNVAFCGIELESGEVCC